jgi:hypothetical protein
MAIEHMAVDCGVVTVDTRSCVHQTDGLAFSLGDSEGQDVVEELHSSSSHYRRQAAMANEEGGSTGPVVGENVMTNNEQGGGKTKLAVASSASDPLTDELGPDEAGAYQALG